MEKKIIINRSNNINWEQVYQDFKARFIEEEYDIWREQFLMDSLEPLITREILKVGEIVQLTNEMQYWATPATWENYIFVETYLGTYKSIEPKHILLKCDGRQFSEEDYPELARFFPGLTIPFVHRPTEPGEDPAVFAAQQTDDEHGNLAHFSSAGYVKQEHWTQLPTGFIQDMQTVLMHGHDTKTAAGVHEILHQEGLIPGQVLRRAGGVPIELNGATVYNSTVWQWGGSDPSNSDAMDLRDHHVAYQPCIYYIVAKVIHNPGIEKHL